MLKRLLIGITLAIAATTAVQAAEDPSMHQVYEAANAGRLAEAQTMITQVLKDHPASAKAHYVAAELDARQGLIGGAREQLQAAEKLDPGLPFAKPEAVQALQAQLGIGSRSAAPAAGHAAGVSIGMLMLIGIGVVLAIIFLLRQLRPAPAPVFSASYPQAGGGYGPSYGPSYGPGYGGVPPSGGGIGSGIAGGLASGLAVGAGIVAGEALAHRFIDGGERTVERDRLIDPSLDDRDTRGNADMGGQDFGVQDSGSWDDGGSSADAGGGGDDWS